MKEGYGCGEDGHDEQGQKGPSDFVVEQCDFFRCRHGFLVSVAATRH